MNTLDRRSWGRLLMIGRGNVIHYALKSCTDSFPQVVIMTAKMKHIKLINVEI